MRPRITRLQIFGIAVGITGFLMVFAAGGWMMAVGLLLALWGDNIDKHSP